VYSVIVEVFIQLMYLTDKFEFIIGLIPRFPLISIFNSEYFLIALDNHNILMYIQANMQLPIDFPGISHLLFTKTVTTIQME
jgi:hypothetical protein